MGKRLGLPVIGRSIRHEHCCEQPATSWFRLGVVCTAFVGLELPLIGFCHQELVVGLSGHRQDFHDEWFILNDENVNMGVHSLPPSGGSARRA
jgi:hypothetical protein